MFCNSTITDLFLFVFTQLILYYPLKLLLEKLHLSSNNLIAFGNNQNDLEMIKFAKVGVAVENAIMELKKNSNFITDSNDNNGMAKFLSEYFKWYGETWFIIRLSKLSSEHSDFLEMILFF